MSPDAYLEMSETEDRHWWFRGRRQILSTLVKSLGLPPQARILEVGSGTGGNLRMLSRFGVVSAMEMDASARQIAHRKLGDSFDVRAGHCPAEIPFRGERFDLICMFDVLEHIDEDTQTLRALGSLLAPGGRLLVTVPAYQWLWSAHDEFLHHKRRYTAARLRRVADNAGLAVRRLSYFNTLLFPLAAIARLKDRLLGSGKATGTDVPSGPVNSALERIFGLERHLLASASLPFGVSLMVVLSATDIPTRGR